MKYILFMCSTYAAGLAGMYAVCEENVFGALLAFSLLTLNLSQLEQTKEVNKKENKNVK
jgi:hypothetical protein